MAEIELRCNNVQCRNALPNSGRACVTTCSHIFCLMCANNSFSKALVCPACETSLTEPDDIVFTDLTPTEDYKSRIKTGDSDGNSGESNVYQTTQEACFQEMIYKNLDEKCNEVSRRLESVIREANQEINGMKEKYNAIQKEQELEKKKTFELKEQYNEKGRQFQKLQLLYDKLKRKTLLQQSSSMNLPPETPKAVHHPQLSNHQIQNIGNLHSARSQPISLSQGVPKFHQASQQLRSFNRFQHLQPETNNSTFANQNQLIFPARQPTPQNNISNSKNLTNSQHQFFQPLTFNSETVTSRRKSDESFLTDTVGLVKPNFVGIKC